MSKKKASDESHNLKKCCPCKIWPVLNSGVTLSDTCSWYAVYSSSYSRVIMF